MSFFLVPLAFISLFKSLVFLVSAQRTEWIMVMFSAPRRVGAWEGSAGSFLRCLLNCVSEPVSLAGTQERVAWYVLKLFKTHNLVDL